jgi:drug/metabolite transporter (DMT)-like permease
MSVPLAYIGVILVWATTPLGIKWSAEGLSPIAGAFGRMLLAAIIAWLIVKTLRITLPWHRQAVRAYGFANIGLFLGLSSVYQGASTLSSGLVSVLFGLSPVVSGLLSQRLLAEPAFSNARWTALALGIAGLSVVFQNDLSMGAGNFTGMLLVLAGMLLFSLSGILVKRENADLHPLAMTTGSLTLAVPLYGLAMLTQGPITIAPTQTSVAAIVYLAIFGSIIGFMCYYYILNHLPASSVALTTLVTPVLAIAIGAALNDEELKPALVLGAAFISASLILYQYGDSLLVRAKERLAAGSAGSGPRSRHQQMVLNTQRRQRG